MYFYWSAIIIFWAIFEPAAWFFVIAKRLMIRTVEYNKYFFNFTLAIESKILHIFVV